MKRYTNVIITDGSGKPMAWDETGKQLAYCTDDSWQDEHHPVQTYTVAKARRLISRSLQQRVGGNLSQITYKTMPFEYPFRKKYVFPRSSSYQR